MSARKHPMARSSNTSPTNTEQRFLLLIYRYNLTHNGIYPEDNWLREEMKFSHQSGVANLKRELKKKGFLNPRHRSVVLTREGWSYCQELSPTITPLRVKLFGEVRAGKADNNIPDTIISNWNENNIDDDFINIPHQGEAVNVFALKVIGKSMEHEGILEDDYVIVEKFTNDEGAKQGELIITYYLSLEDANLPMDQFEAEALLIGPVVKYYFRERNSIFLGWRTDRKQAPDHYRIQAARIRPIGRVIGIYRHMASKQ